MKVVIADSNMLIRTGLHTLLGHQHDMDICGEAATSTELLELIKHKKPDIVIVDFAAKNFNIDVVPAALKISKKTRFVAITGEQSGITIVNALRAGIRSYIKKDCDAHEIVESVKQTAQGGRFFCGQILNTIRKESIDVEDLHIKEFSCEPINISDRELEIITLIAEGYTNNEIAEKLFLSPHTVNTHRKNILQKLGVNNTASIVMYAVKSNLVSPDKFLFSPTV